jgi:chemotaxis protein CheX
MAQKCYELEKKDGHVVLRFTGPLDYYSGKNFEEDLDGNSDYAHAHVIAYCEPVISFPQDWVRILLKWKGVIRPNGKHLVLTNVSSKLMENLKRLGLDKSFKIAKDVKEAVDELGLASKKSIDTEFINPFLEAALHVLQVQAKIEASAGQIYTKKSSEGFSGEISGVIDIVSDSFRGSVVISFPAETFLKILSRMIGGEFTQLDDSNIAGAGEVTNMIVGNAKVVLNQKGYNIKAAIPRVKRGRGAEVTPGSRVPVIVVPFTSQVGDFWIEIWLSSET